MIADAPFKRGIVNGPPPLARFEIVHDYPWLWTPTGCLVESADGAALPEHVFRDAVVQWLRTLLCRLMAIQNVLHSSRMERVRVSEMMNSVYILQHEHGIPLAEAVAQAVAIHDGYVV